MGCLYFFISDCLLTISECSFIIESYLASRRMGDSMRRKDDEKQNSIKRSVVQLILQEGFHGTSISKIARLAGVSPATVYIYYQNKEEMLRDIYREYAEDVFDYLLPKLLPDMSGEELIDVLIRQYYCYIHENAETFHFVEQFRSCPSLHEGCRDLSGPSSLNGILCDYKARGILNDFDNENILAMLFYPVKTIAIRPFTTVAMSDDMLDEMIGIIRKALLK